MYNNDKKSNAGLLTTILPAIIMFVAGLSMILCAAFLGGREDDVPASIITEYVTDERIFVEGINYYVIREDDDGFLSVYLSDGTLYRNLDIYVWSLSESDRELLKIGIMAESDEELAAYIEGFSG